MIRTLLTVAIASLVLLFPAHSHVKAGSGDAIINSQVSFVQIKPLQTPIPTHVEPLQTALHPLSSGLLNLYAWGNCTAYVASRLPVPSNWGNANRWDDNAHAMGITVSTVPKIGAIAQSDTDYYLGHVALVTGISGNVVTVIEMNYSGLGVIDTRVASPGEFVYIYF